ncbi:MAG: ATP-grasp domain-containing protein [Acidobacteriota bacterium]|nr:ATP-grasp domain-containing protein [Acidobacteriota bacterium]
MHVIFVEPAFPANQPRFVEALHSVGALVTAIGEAPFASLPQRVKERLHGYEQVGSVCDEGALLRAVRAVQKRGWVDRLEATVEAHILPAARVRAAATIPGTSVETAFLCRDKPAMKEALRRAGVPCAQSIGAGSADEIREFAGRVGFPLIVKPRGGAGAADTERVDSEAQLEAAIAAHHVGAGGEVAVEEFVEGHEGFFDTLTIDGRIEVGFICHYYPGVLEAMRTRWISPYLITTNRVEEGGYGEVWEMGRRVISALGIGTSATHQEWFFGPKGLRFSEIGCRPPGVLTWDLYSAANDFDLYREWANAIVHGRTESQPSRRYSAALVNFRPDRDGRIAGYQGVREVQDRLGEWILDARLPPPGTPTQPVGAGYMANAWMRIRHPDYDRLREMVEWAGRTVRVYAAPA